MKRFIGTVTAVAALLCAQATAAAPAAAAAAAAEVASKFKVGDAAPDFTLQEVGGEKIQLSSVTKTKVVLLAFWSLRCGACVSEVPFLEQLHKRNAARDAQVVSVLTDGVDAATSKSIMADVGVEMSYPVLVDPDFTASDIYTNFIVPHTLVIDRAGIIRYQHVGFEKGLEKQYEAAVLQALGS